ncbi:unnamed protein product [Caenorhabditis brenneri]
MIPVSSNLPNRKSEQKFRRREGKSQCRKGSVSKSRGVPPSLVSAPSKLPSPRSTPSPNPPPTAPSGVLPVLSKPTASGTKDPLPNLPSREEKAGNRKKMKEKEPPRTTYRKKKNSVTQSCSVELKTSSENDGGGGSKEDKKKSNSQGGTRRRKSAENKSSGSKESTENDEKTPRRFDKEMAKSFFQYVMDSRKSRKRCDDALLETMPESSQLNSSARALRKKMKKTPKVDQPETNFFKPNGDPIWMFPEIPVGERLKDENGEEIKNPELAAALAEDNIEIEEKLQLIDQITNYVTYELEKGPVLSEDYEFDAFAPLETLKSNNECFDQKSMTYNTIKNMVEGSAGAIARFSSKKNGIEEVARPNRSQEEPLPSSSSAASTELFQLKTCIMTSITFDLKNVIRVTYDRHHPITSMKKFSKKLNSINSVEQTTQVEKD